jgi:hypothetical protein
MVRGRADVNWNGNGVSARAMGGALPAAASTLSARGIARFTLRPLLTGDGVVADLVEEGREIGEAVDGEVGLDVGMLLRTLYFEPNAQDAGISRALDVAFEAVPDHDCLVRGSAEFMEQAVEDFRLWFPDVVFAGDGNPIEECLKS